MRKNAPASASLTRRDGGHIVGLCNRRSNEARGGEGKRNCASQSESGLVPVHKVDPSRIWTWVQGRGAPAAQAAGSGGVARSASGGRAPQTVCRPPEGALPFGTCARHAGIRHRLRLSRAPCVSGWALASAHPESRSKSDVDLGPGAGGTRCASRRVRRGRAKREWGLSPPDSMSAPGGRSNLRDLCMPPGQPTRAALVACSLRFWTGDR